MNQNNSVKENIFLAVLVALIFIGIQFLRIPLPFLPGEPVLHFAQLFIVLSLFAVDYVKVTGAALAGLILYQVFQGDYAGIVGLLLTTPVSCLAAGTVYNLWMDQDNLTARDEYIIAVKGLLLYGAFYLLANLAWGSFSAMRTGTKAASAAISAISSSLPLFVNTIFTLIIAVILYVPVHAFLKKILKG